MGRRRAAFRQDVIETDRAVAQLLRDIRDARGETQEELGRLLGWSAPKVSRLEAATERLDPATHRRYCSLAPTGELRAALSSLKSPSSIVATRRPTARRSNEEWHGRALEGSGLYRLLREQYPDYPMLELFGDQSRPLPVWAELAPPSHWEDVEGTLGDLDLSRPAPGVREWPYWEPCDPRGAEEFQARLAEWDRQVREIHLGRRRHLDTWNQLTYDLGSIQRTDGRLRFHCKVGTYYHSLSTSEALEPEIMDPYSAWPDYDPEEAWPKLERRAWLHERVPDPVTDGSHRSAALGVSTLTIVRIRRPEFDGYKMFLSPRSTTVATQRRRYHVIPSGMFQPFVGDGSPDALRAQFSVRTTVMREFVEELYGVEEFETGDGRVDHNAIFRRREARLLTDLLERGDARLLYTGVAVNLLALRPEICTLLVIDDPGWYEQEGPELRLCDEYLRQSERTELLPDQLWVQTIALDRRNLTPDPDWSALLRPATLYAPGWAGVDLGLQVAREALA